MDPGRGAVSKGCLDKSKAGGSAGKDKALVWPDTVEVKADHIFTDFCDTLLCNTAPVRTKIPAVLALALVWATFWL